jgi:hypothetical protein
MRMSVIDHHGSTEMNEKFAIACRLTTVIPVQP